MKRALDLLNIEPLQFFGGYGPATKITTTRATAIKVHNDGSLDVADAQVMQRLRRMGVD